MVARPGSSASAGRAGTARGRSTMTSERAAGFTLLEMLVVLLIAGMALALTTQALGQYQRAHSRAIACVDDLLEQRCIERRAPWMSEWIVPYRRRNGQRVVHEKESCDALADDVGEEYRIASRGKTVDPLELHVRRRDDALADRGPCRPRDQPSSRRADRHRRSPRRAAADPALSPRPGISAASRLARQPAGQSPMRV